MIHPQSRVLEEVVDAWRLVGALLYIPTPGSYTNDLLTSNMFIASGLTKFAEFSKADPNFPLVEAQRLYIEISFGSSNTW